VTTSGDKREAERRVRAGEQSKFQCAVVTDILIASIYR
jgi:hypothetical protein